MFTKILSRKHWPSVFSGEKTGFKPKTVAKRGRGELRSMLKKHKRLVRGKS